MPNENPLWRPAYGLMLPGPPIDSGTPKENFEKLLRDNASHPVVEYYSLNGTWWETSTLTDDEEEIIERKTKKKDDCCYLSAQTNAGTSVEYVEGYILEPAGGMYIPIPHAWLTLNDKVVEITANTSKQDKLYYGAKFSLETISEIMIERRTADPIVEAIVDRK
jgi:hypothetical protein